MPFAFLSCGMIKPGTPLNGSSDHWRKQVYAASAGANLCYSRYKAETSKPENPLQESTKVSVSTPSNILRPAFETKEVPSPTFSREVDSSEAMFSLVEDVQFLQWLVLTGRLFDPQTFSHSPGHTAGHSDSLQEYFCPPSMSGA